MMWRMVYALVAALVMTACGGTGRSVDMHDVEHHRWSVAEDFVYDNHDTLSRRDIGIVVRYGGERVSESVAMTILTLSPDSLVVAEPFTLHIPQMGDMRPAEHTFIYRHNAVLSRKGKYLFRLTPTTAAEGISSVGIVITEPETVE
ncbi:MAG: hypothetical protein IJX40_02575 [Alistipes sp.]|nr:hypothetical protein [Alistipes sp.]